jgi:UDPglucose 6-dehydrogenase
MRRWAILTLRHMLGGSIDQKKIGILGLAFKPNTDDIREAPAIDIARMLQNEGAQVSAYDPVAMVNAGRSVPNLRLAEDVYDLADQADALLIVTEWNEFKQVDLARIRSLMRQPVVVDGRNLYDPEKMSALGFEYRSVGRGNFIAASNGNGNGHHSEDGEAVSTKVKAKKGK